MNKFILRAFIVLLALTFNSSAIAITSSINPNAIFNYNLSNKTQIFQAMFPSFRCSVDKSLCHFRR